MNATLVLDWNGTVLDDSEIILQAINSIISRFNKPALDMDALREKCEFPFSTLYKNLGLSESEVEIIQENGNALFHDYYESHANAAPLRRGLDEIFLFTQRKSIEVVVLSNHISGPINRALQRLGIKRYIACVLAYENRAVQYMDMTKGQKLALYMEEKGINPASTFIVGDTVEECNIARDLKIKSIAITGGVVSEERLRNADPNYLIHSHAELKNILMGNEISKR